MYISDSIGMRKSYQVFHILSTLSKGNQHCLLHNAVYRGNARQKGCCSEWVRPRTSLWWTDGYYPEINPFGNKLCTGILSVLRFKTVWEIIQCCLTSKRHTGFGQLDLHVLNVDFLRGWEIMHNLL